MRPPVPEFINEHTNLNGATNGFTKGFEFLLVIIRHLIDPRWTSAASGCRLNRIAFSSVVAHDSTTQCS
jgi:hypothetical protein